MLREARFNCDGVITSRGDEVAKHKNGDKLWVVRKVTDDVTQVIVTEGEAKGLTVIVDNEFIEFN